MATANFTFTTLTGTETAGWNSINTLITSIDTQLNTSNRLVYMSGWSAVAGQTIKWDATNSRWVPGTLDSAALANDSVTSAQIAANAVGSSEIAADAVGSDEIAAGAVTLAKISPTGSSAGQVLTSTGSSSDPSWQNASIGEANIANNAVTNAKLRDSTGLSVIGRATNSTGDPADINAVTDHHVLRRSGSTLGFGLITGNNITNNTITSDKLSLSSGGSLTLIDEEFFDTSTTYTMPTNAKIVVVECIAAGAGGAAGRWRASSANNASGGTGGPGGGYSCVIVNAATLTALGQNITVTIGAGGLGGAGNSVDNQDTPGSYGGTSLFGHVVFLGSTTTNSAPSSLFNQFVNVFNSALMGYPGSGGNGGIGTAGTKNYIGGGAGGGGGGTNSTTAFAGGAGSNSIGNPYTSQASFLSCISGDNVTRLSLTKGGGGAGGAANSAGSTGTTYAGILAGGDGGGGGGASLTTSGKVGGDGVYPGGGGGGGGGAASPATSSGSGGNGAAAAIQIKVYG